MKKYLNALVLAGGGVFLAPFAHAGEDTISKVSAAKSSFVLSNGEGLANVNQLHASATDFRSGTLSKPKN